MNLNTAAAGATPTEAEIADAQMFCKVAADQGIDLGALPDEHVQFLWEEFHKVAEDEKKEDESSEEDAKEDEKEEEKKEAAAREHAVKVAQAAEEARADHLGRVMAHSYLDELQKVAAAREAEANGETKEAGMPPQLAAALGKVRGAASSAASKGKEMAGAAAAKGKELGGKALGAAKSNPGKTLGGAAAAGAAAGFGAGRASKKHASVSHTDELAMRHAVKIAAEAGLDPEEVELKVAAVAVLGLGESDKLASDLDSQIHIRALEYIEAAGYPVTWGGQS